MDDQQRLARLFSTYSPVVLRRARRLMGNAADAEEILQDVFIRAMRHEVESESDGDLMAWFYRVTTNLCLNRLRNEKRRRELFREHVAPHGSSSAARPETEAEMTIRWLLANADERQARCAAYAYLDELTYDEIAGVMGVSKRTVSNLMDRFKDWARDELARGAQVEATA